MAETDAAATAAWFLGFVATQQKPEQMSDWVERTMAEILDKVTGIPDEVLPRVHVAIGDHWRAFLDRVGDPTSDFVLVESARELAADCARLHVPLPVLLHVYQAAQTASWQFAVDVVGHAPSTVDHEAAIIALWTQANAWFAASIEQSVEVFTAEANRVRQRGDARRYEHVATLLDGADMAASDLSAALDHYPITGVDHVALIAHAMSPESIERLDGTVSWVIGRVAHGARSVLVRPGGREIWAWIAVRQVSSTDPAVFDDDRIDPSEVRVMVGTGGEGVAGFVAAHRDARRAGRVALAPGRRQTVTVYDDVAAVTMLAADHPAAERFARKVLRELQDPAHDKLRVTARMVLTATNGVDGVADALGIHRNTVRYRIAQIERMTGRPLAERAGDLLLALDYYEAFLGGVR